jgi:hypothetical protein
LAHNPKLQKWLGGGFLERIFLNVVWRIQIFLLKFHKDPEAVRLMRQVRRERRSLQFAYGAYMVYSFGKCTLMSIYTKAPWRAWNIFIRASFPAG